MSNHQAVIDLMNENGRLRAALQKILETTDDGCVEELAERALASDVTRPERGGEAS